MTIITSSRYVESNYFSMVSKEERYDGIWWTASNPNHRIPGTLNVTSEAILLKLNGALETKCYSQDISYDLILGIQSGGYLFTLEGCVATQCQFPFSSGYSRQDFVVNQVYGGIHVKNVDELKFYEYRVNYSYLKEWLRNVGLEPPKVVENGFFIGYDSDKYTTTPKLEALVDDISIEIVSEPAHFFNDNSRNSGVCINEIVNVTCHSLMSVKEVSTKIINPFQDFLTLATGVPNSVTRLSAKNPQENNLDYINIYAQNPYPAQPIFSLFNQRIILFYANQVANDFSHYLNKWLKLEEEMRDICELFFGIHYDQGAFSTNRLLNIVQALEAYSRVRFGKYNEPKDTHKKRVKAIVGNAPTEYHSWLKNALSHANYKSLKSRLIELVDKASPIVDKLIPNSQEFAKWVVDTRNYLTHRDREGKKRIASDDNLDSMIYSLIWLLRIYFLREVGFDDKQCTELLSKNNSFKSLYTHIADSKAPWHILPNICTD